MNYILYGIGQVADVAIQILGIPRVKLCVTTNPTKTEFWCKKVIPFEELRGMDLSGSIVVIASTKYASEMEELLLTIPNVRYFKFRPDEYYRCERPHYYFYRHYEEVSFTRRLAFERIEQYSRIAILGTTPLLPLLIAEIAFQSGLDRVLEVISDTPDGTEQTLGVPLVSWEEANKDFDCLIVNIPDFTYPGRSGLLDTLGGDTAVIDLYYDADVEEPLFRHPELEKYRDIYRGKRVFLIGNGPSLSFDDLQKLHDHGEICFGGNMIYRAYDKTKWRADYLCLYDTSAIKDSCADFPRIPGTIFLGDSYHYRMTERKYPNVEYIHIIHADFHYLPNRPGFSDDIVRGVYEGFSVLFTIGMQVAAYMGVKEIYLLGVDHNYTSDREKNYFIEGYRTDGEWEMYLQEGIPTVEEQEIVTRNATAAFEAAERYSRKHGFRIYNATRGGKLEVFERVDFDSLWDEGKREKEGS